MARIPRNALADGRCFHLFARGVDHLTIFRDWEDRLAFLELLAQVVGRERRVCDAFRLMDTHVHLVVEAHLEKISRGMQRLLGKYARRFNDRHGRVGHLFGDRYGARVIADDGLLHDVVEYVILNPVRAGIVDSAADWPWSASRFDPS